jgi:hypothetical protein
MQRNKAGYQYTRRDQNFVEEAMNEGWERNLTGTRVEYIEPEGSEAHLSMLSLDDEPEPEIDTNDNDNDDTPINLPIGPKKAKFKKMAKRLYPAKVVGGAKALGGAIRHPMVTGRKVNGFVKRKNGATTATRGEVLVEGWDFPETTTDGLPPLTRCATVSEREMFTQDSTPSTPGITP